MLIDIDTGWIRDVRRVPSPNCDARPPGSAPELIVVHGISLPPKDFGGRWIDDLFVNQLDRRAHPYFETISDLTVSAHVLVTRDGRPTQYVSFDQRAWHAGESCWRGRRACNDFAVGIELEGADDVPYAPQQYDTLARIVAALRRAYPTLRDAEIVGHSDVAPGRKTDPGPAFDWERLMSLLKLAG
ncbi:MAG: 1,6-anhydro-N-acetylmuramyl-L-alanine amidase AmpD [Gammaproteobacteria bacterium]|nr:1,6-anhydro-N-acetylmuramyl-L-alanine amidase AmpD [Gammaproteobacteria bacterium]